MNFKSLLFIAASIIMLSCAGNSNKKNSGQNGKTIAENTAYPKDPSPEVAAVNDNNIDLSKMESGKEVYNRTCLACHQTNGQGVPGTFPPLVETKKVLGSKDTLITLLLKGMSGQVEVKGEMYSGTMPPQDYLSDEELANVLTYIRKNFGNSASAVTEEEVKSIREKIQ
ncbi:MAG TPA: cytochrome c [Bacteroidales bacterium]|nr:cytochrome c [Bacteroidales bacterium]